MAHFYIVETSLSILIFEVQMGLRGFITSRISAAVVGIRQLRCAANTRLRIAYAANVQGAFCSVIAINAAFGAGAAGAAGFAVCFIQIAAVGADCLGAVFAVGIAGAVTISTADAGILILNESETSDNLTLQTMPG